MKLILTFACIFAMLAIATADDKSAKLLELDSDVKSDGFHYKYKIDNSIDVEQSGKLHDEKELKVEGSYTYKSPEGIPIVVKYVADEHGYHPKVSQT